ncbi:MAG TPA: ABC transporter permease [Acidimicrobiia bacterium]|nr:ABC transporter permease [Acidimicrobiia bacterium]
MNRDRVLAIARRQSYVLWRAPQRWFDVVVWPVVDAVLFGAIGVYFGGQQGSAAGGATAGAAFLLAGIILFHVVFQAEVSVATGFLEETWSRNLLNLMVTPMTELEYGAGVALFGVAKLAMGVGVVSVVAFAAFAFDISSLGLSLVPLVAILMVVGWAAALVVIGLILRVGQGAEILTWGFIALLLPLSGIFYPVSALPGALQPISEALPTTHVFAAAHDLVDGKPLPWDEVAIAAGGAVVAAVLGVWFLTRMLAVFRSRGYISRHV